MTREQADILAWLAAEQRSPWQLLAMHVVEASDWNYRHGGTLDHVEALLDMREQLKTLMATQTHGVANVVRWSR